MKLGGCTYLTQGAFINRIQTSNLHEESWEIGLLTLKEFNDTLGLSYRMSQGKSKKIFVLKDKISEDIITDTNSLVMHTLSQKVALLPEKYSGLLLTNNFIKIEFIGEVDLSFMEWYLNEHPAIQKQIALFSEGSVISSLKLSHLRDIDISLPPLEEQHILGKVTVLKKRKENLFKEKIQLEQQLIHQTLVNVTEMKAQEEKK
ncbi:restriction endonuclease subunit S [Priestia megaterium]|uniref:restriction endonuclease subunit S n=1 Tax=Priestia megaterium TaxID=1404 RepID=UPI0025A355F1|nr:restriction endonuclease subunit S [Priestia megaterium]MDM8151042.1 restriction endonuclease subunit S [Priestia megaterium]